LTSHLRQMRTMMAMMAQWGRLTTLTRARTVTDPSIREVGKTRRFVHWLSVGDSKSPYFVRLA
jgi:hypothetical protein